MINGAWGPIDIVNDDTSREFFWIALGTLLALGIAVTALQRSPSGRSLFAVRDSENAATAVGISLTYAKLSAFALSAGIAGLGGALISLGDFGVVSSNDFFIGNSILYLALIILAGIRSVWGALLAGTFFIWGPNVIAWILSHAGFSTLQAANYQQMLSGALLILTVIVNPRGILGGLDDIPHLIRPMGRRARTTTPYLGAPTAPSTVA
jgi:ABC-type branched-subunit amino acid transport system permease subunit